jgi:ankyrin repeat protein
MDSFFSCCHCGAGKGQLDTLKVLAKSGANLWLKNHRGDLPLHEAVHSGRKDLVRWLLVQRPEATDSSNNDGRCPLHIAAINNHVEMCKVNTSFTYYPFLYSVMIYVIIVCSKLP